MMANCSVLLSNGEVVFVWLTEGTLKEKVCLTTLKAYAK